MEEAPAKRVKGWSINLVEIEMSGQYITFLLRIPVWPGQVERNFPWLLFRTKAVRFFRSVWPKNLRK